MRKTQSAILDAVHETAQGLQAAGVMDQLTMREFDRLYPGYGFAEHKGYGTPQHLAAIQALGACPIHRRSFSPFRPVATELELFDSVSEA